MTTISLDQISRRWLLEQGLPIHFYAEGLYQAATCLRELSFDALKIINFANLPVDSTGNIYTPEDFVDDLAVTLPLGQSLASLPKQDWITPIRLHDSVTGEFVPYQGQGLNVDGSRTFWGFPGGWGTWSWNVNSFGESTGGYFGASGGTNSGYQVFKAQRRIQLSEDLINTNVVLLYISDGQSADAATQIDPLAFATINAFIRWQRSNNRDNKDSPEGRLFYNERRRLIARLDPLTTEDVKNVLRQSYTAAIKN